MGNTLFSSYSLGQINLSNRIVMAPMTRCRAVENVPNDLMVEYYTQRANAGLIITEGTSPSPNGVGYNNMPGLYNKEQAEAWKKVTDSVHAKGGKIFVQLMHAGRISHPDNLPEGARVLAPSAIAANDHMYVSDTESKPLPVPEEMSLQDIKDAIEEYVNSAKLAVEAGFDGVEIHGANGYLIEQFINPSANQRTDEYGGSIENRIRFAVEIAEKVVAAIGKEKVGMRVSPYGVNGDLALYDEIDETYALLAKKINEIGLLYVHIVDHSSMGAPEVKESVKDAIRSEFKNTVILSGGYDLQRAENDLEAGKGQLVAFGRPFIANPDLVNRLTAGISLQQPDMATFYGGGPKGYIDYPAVS